MKLKRDKIYLLSGKYNYNEEVDKQETFALLVYMKTDTIFKSANYSYVFVGKIELDKYFNMMRFGNDFSVEYNGVYDINKKIICGYWDRSQYKDLQNPSVIDGRSFKLLFFEEPDFERINFHLEYNNDYLGIPKDKLSDINLFKKYILEKENELQANDKLMYDYYLNKINNGYPSDEYINRIMGINQIIYELESSKKEIYADNFPVKKLINPK